MRRGRGFTVALIGPDGAGKTTVAAALESSLELPVAYLYMGVSLDSSNSVLPTTRVLRAVKRALGAPPDRAGPRRHETAAASSTEGRGSRRPLRGVRAALRLTNRLAEEWYRQARAWALVRRGSVVVFDRHFFADYYAYDIDPTASRTRARRVHGFVLDRLYPRPDLTVYLDAPADVLLARKGEGTAELLERRRRDYLGLASVLDRFVVVDAGRPLDEVTREVAEHVRSFGAARAAVTSPAGA